jgi:hypothetical protein
LLTAGYRVNAVNPLQAAHYRERHGVSGAKSDTGDAHILADMVRTDRHQLRPVAGDSAEAERRRCVARSVGMLKQRRGRGQMAWASSVNAAVIRRVGGMSMASS